MIFGIRHAQEDDKGFVFKTWLKGYRYGSSIGRSGMRNAVFYKQHHRAIEAILNRPGAETLICHLPDDPGIILGFLVYEPGCIHWCHVKENFRRRGIATQLVQNAGFPQTLEGVELSHVSDDWYEFLKAKHPGAVYVLHRQFWRRDPEGVPAGSLSHLHREDAIP